MEDLAGRVAERAEKDSGIAAHYFRRFQASLAVCHASDFYSFLS